MSRAGAAQRNTIAGPSPAPRLRMPLNSGKAVHDQTERTIPLTMAIEYEIIRLVLAPRYFKTRDCETKTLIPPAIKKAGTSPVRTLSEKQVSRKSIARDNISISFYLSFSFFRQVHW
jgi:hypothetical protein